MREQTVCKPSAGSFPVVSTETSMASYGTEADVPVCSHLASHKCSQLCELFLSNLEAEIFREGDKYEEVAHRSS